MPSEISMNCPNFALTSSGIELTNVNQTWLDQNTNAWGGNDNEYSFDCSLEINTGARQEIPITISSEYTVEYISPPYALTGATPQQ